MHRHSNTMFLRCIADLLGLQNAARRCQIGMDDRNSALLEERHKAFFEVDILSGADGCRDGARQGHVLVGELPGQEVLEPCQCELVKGPAVGCTTQVRCGRYDLLPTDFVSNDAPHVINVPAEIVDAFVRELDAGEWVHDVEAA